MFAERLSLHGLILSKNLWVSDRPTDTRADRQTDVQSFLLLPLFASHLFSFGILPFRPSLTDAAALSVSLHLQHRRVPFSAKTSCTTQM